MTRWRIRSWKSWRRRSRRKLGRVSSRSVMGGAAASSAPDDTARPIVWPRLHEPLVHHRVGHLQEARDVGAVHVIACAAEAVRGLDAGLVDALHDEAQA